MAQLREIVFIWYLQILRTTMKRNVWSSVMRFDISNLILEHRIFTKQSRNIKQPIFMFRAQTIVQCLILPLCQYSLSFFVSKIGTCILNLSVLMHYKLAMIIFSQSQSVFYFSFKFFFHNIHFLHYTHYKATSIRN